MEIYMPNVALYKCRLEAINIQSSASLPPTLFFYFISFFANVVYFIIWLAGANIGTFFLFMVFFFFSAISTAGWNEFISNLFYFIFLF